MPCILVSSELDGPSVVVTANLHGDEVTGVATVHAIVERLPTALLRGRIALYPSLNPKGLERGSRAVPGDPDDPNRNFPGNPRGTPSQQHAHAVWQSLDAHKPQFAIDLHADAVAAIPYALVDRVLSGYPQLFDRCRQLASSSGLTVVHEYPAPQYHAFGLARSFTGAITNGMGIPAVTLEVGPRRTIDPCAVTTTVDAVMSMLGHIGVCSVEPGTHRTCVRGGPWRRENGPRTNHTGLLVPLVSPGVLLERGAPIVEVRDVAGQVLDRLTLPRDGFVLSFPDQAWLGAGVAAATLAVADP
jgi:predicted deacylase